MLPQTVRNFIITNLISAPDGVGEVDVDDGETDDGIVIVGECCPCCLEEKKLGAATCCWENTGRGFLMAATRAAAAGGSGVLGRVTTFGS